MSTALIDDERVTPLNDHEPGDGDHVLYWMQAAVRTRDNHALEFAVRTANDLGLPLLVGFGLDPDYEDATARTLRFVVEGLRDVAAGLARRDIPFAFRHGPPAEIARELAGEAAAIVTDRNYLRDPRRWRREIAAESTVAMWEVEANVVVPVAVASDTREWAARTIRPKLHREYERFVVRLRTTPLDRSGSGLPRGFSPDEPADVLRDLGVDQPGESPLPGGENAAYATLTAFIDGALSGYGSGGEPVRDGGESHLSAYLHYGHISPVEILRRVLEQPASESRDEFVEEVLVRRELAHNFVWFEPDYDSFSALPDWARESLRDHGDDERPARYTKRELAEAATDDPYWNAAMVEMRETGLLHNRLRMYWGKRIIEWTNTPEYAYRVALELNNRYLLDGRDPNSFANVGWVFGLHDQAFKEREVFGKVRPMTAGGLERKIDADRYVSHVEEVTGVTIRGR